MKTYEVIARTLSESGVNTVFGLMGSANMQYLVTYVDRHGGRFVTSSHESSSVSMAEGYSRISGEVGVASVTHGPALVNSLTAITEAARSRSAVLVLTGSTPAGREQLQSADLAALTAPTGAHFERVHRPETAVDDFHRAMWMAITDRRPVVLDIPFDVLDLEAGQPESFRPLPSRPEPASPNPGALDAGAEQIRQWRKPLILVGNGIDTTTGRDAVRLLAEALGAPIVSSLLARAGFADQPSYIGLCGGLAYGAGRRAIEEADGILVLGSSLTHHTADSRRGLLSGKTLIQVDSEPMSVGTFTPVAHAIIGDATKAAQGLTSRIQVDSVASDSQWARQAVSDVLAEDPHEYYTTDWSGHGLSVRDAVLALQDQIPDNVTMVSDLGRFFVTPWRHLPPKKPGAFMHAASFGGIGLGLATALGAAVGRPDRPTILLAGDGGLMLSLHELHTAVRYNLPLVILLFNDGAYGAEYSLLQGYGLDPNYSLIDWPDFSAVAAAIGYRTLTASNVEGLGAVQDLVAGLMEGGVARPVLINIEVDPTIDHFEW